MCYGGCKSGKESFSLRDIALWRNGKHDRL